jgi:hypothetical protein
MYSSFGIIALAATSLLAPTPDLTWHTSYAHAVKECQATKKPMAVVVGTGIGGYNKVVKEGKLSDEAMNLLQDNYICCYIDASTPEGQKLANDLALTNTVGVVLSDRTGSLQAFYHKGDLATNDLVRFLKRCADPNRSVTTTETLTSQRTSMYVDPATSPTGYNTPMGYNAPMYGSSFGYTSAPYGHYGAPMFTGGSCPNCRRY